MKEISRILDKIRHDLEGEGYPPEEIAMLLSGALLGVASFGAAVSDTFSNVPAPEFVRWLNACHDAIGAIQDDIEAETASVVGRN